MSRISAPRLFSVEEILAMPPPTEDERLERRRAMEALFAEVRREQEAFVEGGGHVMTDAEWQDWWDHQNDDDNDWRDSPK